jgi:hemerythrin-like metal-binding protein
MPGAWTQCLPTGWEDFDREHASLVAKLAELLSAVNAADRARASAALAAFLDACAEHFTHEERLMELNSYGQLARHKEAHDLFLADVRELSANLAANGITPDFRRWAAGRVLEWFRFHVSANDVALGVYLVYRRRRGDLHDDAAIRPAAAARR